MPVRQLSAVELRKQVVQKWVNVSAQDKAMIKNGLLNQVLLNETSKPVKHSAGRVVCSIAELELSKANQWPELVPYLFQLARDTNVTNRESGVFVLETITSHLIDDEDPAAPSGQLPQLFELFTVTLNDPESLDVRVSTVQALGLIADSIEKTEKKSIAIYQSLVPGIVNVLQQCLDNENEDACKQIFDVVDSLLLHETPLVSKYVKELIEFLLRTSMNKDYEDTYRIMGLNALLWVIRYKKSKVQSYSLAPVLIEQLLYIGCEADGVDDDDEVPSRVAFRVLDTIATSLPPTQVFPSLHSQLVLFMASPDETKRKSAMKALGVTVEGCSEFIRPHMDKLWPMLESGLADASPLVRKASCMALGCMCDVLADECAERHQSLLPLIFSNLEAEATQNQALLALDAFLETLEDKILPFLPALMERLINMLDAVSVESKTNVVASIGSAAHAGKTAFQPYFEGTMSKLVNFLGFTEGDQEIELRATTIDTIGTLAEAVGRQAFSPYFSNCMQCAFNGLQMSSSRLNECTFVFFANMSKVLEQDFAPCLAQVIPLLVLSLEQPEPSPITDLVEEVSSENNNNKSVSNIMQNIQTAVDEEEIDMDKLMTMSSAIAQEKEIAADALGEIFSHTGEAFFPYMETTLGPLVEGLDHYYEGLRKTCVTSLSKYLQTFYELTGPTEWAAGLPVAVPVNENVMKLNKEIMPKIITDLWDTETEMDVVSAICQELAEMIQKCGPAIIEGHELTIATRVLEILEGKSQCQLDPDDEDASPDEDQAEYAQLLISSATDLVGAMAATLGADFVPYFQTMLPFLSKYYASSRSNSERSTSIGSFGEIIAGLKSAITPFTPQIYQILLAAISDSDVEVRSNAAFAIGLLVQHSDSDLSSMYMTILSSLQPFFNVSQDCSEQEGNSRDNATGAVCRMIVKNSSALPLGQVLPAIFSAMPLKYDFQENDPAYKAIFHLFRSKSEAIMPFLPQLRPIIAYNLDPAHSAEITELILTELKQLVSALPA